MFIEMTILHVEAERGYAIRVRKARLDNDADEKFHFFPYGEDTTPLQAWEQATGTARMIYDTMRFANLHVNLNHSGMLQQGMEAQKMTEALA